MIDVDAIQNLISRLASDFEERDGSHVHKLTGTMMQERREAATALLELLNHIKGEKQ